MPPPRARPMATTNGTKPKEPKFPPIPVEWKVELPDEGYRGSNAIGGCRSIEEGYDRQGVLGQGTYGEVRLSSMERGCRAQWVCGVLRARCWAVPRGISESPCILQTTTEPHLLRCTKRLTWRPTRLWPRRRSRWTMKRRVSPSRPFAVRGLGFVWSLTGLDTRLFACARRGL